ncbi:hypothetical protein JST97_36565 [bacterium]|nr:hypothetical protein [bacterium]
MTLRCWNCGTEESRADASVCALCGEFLRPETEQRTRARERVEYLIRELRRWKSVPDWWKNEAEENYRRRLKTLRELPSTPIVESPAVVARASVDSLMVEGLPERMEAPDIPDEQVAALQVVTQVDPPVAPPPPPRQRSATSAEKQAAFQALLDHQVELPQLPVETHTPSEADLAMQMLMGAFSEKKIRLLYALGGVLLLAAGVGILGSNWDGWGRQAMALLLTLLPVLFFWLARRLEEVLPVSSRMFTVLGGAMLPVGLLFLEVWRAPAFLIGFVVNRRHAKEPICVYLSGLCWALTGWALGGGLPLGLLSFAGAAVLLKMERDNPHWIKVAHGLSLLGLLSAFTRGQLEAGTATTLFLLAITYFTTCALVLNTTRAMVGASLVSLLCAAWLSSLLEWPTSTVGLAALLQGALYFRRNQTLALTLPAAILLLFVGLPMLAHPFQADALQMLTGVLGTAFYAYAAYAHNRPVWAYAAALCALYSYFTLLGLTHIATYRPWMVAVLLATQIVVTLLRYKVPHDYLRPWAFTAAGTALLLVPLNAVLQMAGADAFTPWVYLGVSATIALCAVFEKESKALYVSMVTAALAYGTWLPIWFGHSSQPNLGLAFTAFVAALALGGLALRKTPYAQPLLVSAAVAGWVFSTMQFGYLAVGYWSSATTALIFYGVGFAMPRKKASNFQAGLCLVTALACFDHLGTSGLTAGLVASALLMALPGYAEAGLLWSACVAVMGPVHLQLFPALLWLGGATYKKDLRLAQASTLLALPCVVLHGLAGANLGLLALQCSALLALSLRWSQASLLVPAWLALKVIYLQAFPEHLTPALWLEWLLFFLVNRKLEKPLPSIEGLTGLCLLAISFWQGGWQAALNPWLVVGLLLYRKQSQMAQVVAVWAAFCGAEVTHQWLVFSAELFLWCLVQPRSLRPLGYLAWLGCLAGGELVPLCGTLALGAGAFGFQKRAHECFGLLYHAYVAVLFHNSVATPEFFTVPLGLWMLRTHRPLGLATLLAPPLLLSLGSGEHALWTGTLAVMLLFTQRPNLMAWGGLALLSEVAIQAVMFASNLPWHQWAVVGGLLLVSLAFLVERRRQEVLLASRAFVASLKSW